MDDLIRREDAIDAVHKTVGKFIPILMVSEENALLDCVREINQLPSAQKKGHWRNYEGTLTCSVCETEIDNGIMEYCGDDVPMFCPNCGADMRGDDDE